jgi:hypothetical protein
MKSEGFDLLKFVEKLNKMFHGIHKLEVHTLVALFDLERYTKVSSKYIHR